jgi:hypothetical protein
MKTLCLLLLSAALLVSCDKPVESDIQFVDLSFVQTTTPKTTTLNAGITSAVKVMGTDLCYNFGYFTVNKQQFVVDVHAIGTYPTHPGACPQALYYKDTTLTIQTTSPGQHILRFYNGSQLFKSDTVQVN